MDDKTFGEIIEELQKYADSFWASVLELGQTPPKFAVLMFLLFTGSGILLFSVTSNCGVRSNPQLSNEYAKDPFVVDEGVLVQFERPVRKNDVVYPINSCGIIKKIDEGVADVIVINKPNTLLDEYTFYNLIINLAVDPIGTTGFLLKRPQVIEEELVYLTPVKVFEINNSIRELVIKYFLWISLLLLILALVFRKYSIDLEEKYNFEYKVHARRQDRKALFRSLGYEREFLVEEYRISTELIEVEGSFNSWLEAYNKIKKVLNDSIVFTGLAGEFSNYDLLYIVERMQEYDMPSKNKVFESLKFFEKLPEEKDKHTHSEIKEHFSNLAVGLKELGLVDELIEISR